MIDDSLLKAEIDRDDIESGVVILTGNALRRQNARQIADLLASFSGKFISISAGDRLESTMAAFGSGAVQQSIGSDCLNVDIGGGTTKISRCVDGKISELTAIEVGGRILQFNADGAVGHAELTLVYTPATDNCQSTELRWIAKSLSRSSIGWRTRSSIQSAVGIWVTRTASVDHRSSTSGTVVLSGGVSQWITATKPADACDDLGERLALKTRDLLQDTGYTIRIANDPIRATVLGASQQRMQVSGNTVFISDERLLPIRNAPVSLVTVPAEDFDQEMITELVKESLSKAFLVGTTGFGCWVSTGLGH